MCTVIRSCSAFRLAMVFGLAIALSGCAPRYVNHGYVPPEDELNQITVGVDTRASVDAALGSAGTGSVVNDTGRFFVRSRMRTVAMFEPEVVERNVVAISFDSSGVVSNVERFGLEQGQVVPLSRRATNSGVTDKSFLRQLLGNIGSFAPQAISGER